MKKILTLLLTASMLICTACGDKTTEKDNSAVGNDKSESEAISNSEQENSVAEPEEKSTEERFYDFCGLNVKEPDNLILYDFVQEDTFWGYGYETDDKLNLAIIFRGLNYADYHDPSTYGAADVWDILNNELQLNISNGGYRISELCDAEVETSEKVDFLGAEFIRSTGVLPIETYDNDEVTRLNYATYYGVLDFPAHGNYSAFKDVPVMFIAFTDVNSDEIKAEIEKIVDDVAENASWLSE